ncbi:MAG: GIY-YIG nuclease family protein [Bacteroidia bacterium]|jgi:putative endonuclease|nr:GIY-YIG nuclease family protein [Bacteroidia bacterium]
MFCVYILYSAKINKFCIGSTDDVEQRLLEHNSIVNKDSFTARGSPWELYLVISNLHSTQAYTIEKHIKQMKSKVFIENLKKYPELPTEGLDRS